jgi:hypothetical protein
MVNAGRGVVREAILMPGPTLAGCNIAPLGERPAPHTGLLQHAFHVAGAGLFGQLSQIF